MAHISCVSGQKGLAIRCFLVSISLVFLLSNKGAANARLVEKSPNDNRQYRAIKLDNDLEVLLVSDPSITQATAALSVGVGAIKDPVTQPGLAHFLEHMLFLGTEGFPEPGTFDQFLARHAGTNNAATWLEKTTYAFSIDEPAFDEALERFSDFFKAPLFSPDYVNKELNAVDAEWHMYKSEDNRALERLSRLLQGDHPLNRFAAGNLETLKDKDNSQLYAELLAFHQRWYSANIMKLVMISSRSLDEMAQLSTTWFSGIKNKGIERPTVTEPLQKAGARRGYFKSIKDERLLSLGFAYENKGAAWTTPEENVIAYILASEMPGTPAAILRERGWVASLTVNQNRLYDYTELSIDLVLTLEGSRHKQAITALIMQFIELLKQRGISADYFNEVQAYYNNQFRFLQKITDFNYAMYLANCMQLEATERVLSAPYQLGLYHAENLMTALQKLTPEALLIIHSSQDEVTDTPMPYYNQSYRIEPVDDGELASWKVPSPLLHLPALNRFIATDFDLRERESNPIPVLRYDNAGIQIWHMQSQAFDHEPKGIFSCYINDTSVDHDIRASVLQSLWVDILDYKHIALWDELSAAGLRVSFGNGIALNGFTGHQQDVLARVLSVIKMPITQTDLDQAAERFAEQLINADNERPYIQSYHEACKLLSAGNYSRDALLATAKTLTLQEFMDYQRKLMVQAPIRAIAYGNYSASDVQAFGEQIRMTMPDNRSALAYQPAKYLLPLKETIFSIQKSVSKENVAVTDMYLFTEPGDNRKATVAILNQHFQKTLYNQLRTEKQLGYAVFSMVVNLKDYTGISIVIETSITSAEGLQTEINAFIADYVKALDAIDEQTFLALKTSLLNKLQTADTTLYEEASPFINDLYGDKLTFDSKQKLEDAIKGMTQASFVALSKSLLSGHRVQRINVQLRGTAFSTSDFTRFDNATLIQDLGQFHQTATYQP